jgi:hypothetical protein
MSASNSLVNPPLEQAPPAVKLAVDLILLLEQNQLDPAVVLAALPIVTRDFQRKLQTQQQAQQ